MATGFESYTVEIDDSGDWDGDTPVKGGFDGMRVHMMAAIGECCLTPGDPSPIGRCPETGDLVYLDRPADRARDAAEALLDALRAILPYAESRAEDMLEADGELDGCDPSDATRKAVAAVDAAKALLASLDGDAPDAADASEGAGLSVRHDLHGFYLLTAEEAEHEDAGNASVGFDGRQHYATLAEAQAASGDPL